MVLLYMTIKNEIIWSIWSILWTYFSTTFISYTDLAPFLLSGIRPATNYFVIFQPGSGHLLSNFVIFYRHKTSFSSILWFLVFFWLPFL